MKWCVVAEETIYSEMFEVLFWEAIKEKEVVFLKQYMAETGIRNRLLDLLYKNKINQYLKSCFEPVLKPKYTLEKFLKENQDLEKTVIFFNGSLQKFYTEERLKRLKKAYPGTHFVLLYVDPLSQKHTFRAQRLQQAEVFDLIYTFDSEDAEKKGFLYCQTPYSRLTDLPAEKIKKRIYFCGSEKGRADILEAVAKRLEELKLDYQFDVYGKEKKQSAHKITYGLTNYKKYREILSDTLKHQGILDIVQTKNPGQAGLSLRVYEATVYDRILLTNNPNIKNYPLYNPKTMHYFSKPEEIQSAWFDTVCENFYQGELSPVHFLEEIQRQLKR